MKDRRKIVDMAIEDLKRNHNWSWADEIDDRNKDNLDNSIIFYRGNQISYRKFMEISDAMAKSLIASGFKKGSEIPVCMSNCPEFVMLLRAISKIGAKVNVFASEFDYDYITQIINDSKAPMLFITDNFYEELLPALDNTDLKNITMFSLTDSLAGGIDPFLKYDKCYYNFKNKVPVYKQEDAKIVDKKEFLELGQGLDIPESDLHAKCSLDDEFLITYTSGSTNTKRPKAIIHNNSSLIYMGRFHDPDLSGLPATRGIRNLAQIPTHSNTDIITSISDSLMQNCEIALEPIYNPDFFIYSLIINEPHFAPATRSFYVRMCKRYNEEKEFQGVKFKNLYIPTIVGEPNTPGEEKYINKTLKKASAGTAILPRPIAPAVISIGGGDCEHGGLFFTLYKKHMELLNSIRLRKRPLGLIPFNPSIEVVCLDKDGRLLGPNEYGVLAANSPCTMKEYKDNPQATEEFYVKDINGKKYANLNVYGYVDEYGTVHMKGRVGNSLILSDGTELPLFVINDIIAKDTKNILSSEVILVDGSIIAYVEPMPDMNIGKEKCISNIAKRLINELPYEVIDMLLFNIIDNEKSYPLTGCGKRSNIALSEPGLTEGLIKAEWYQDEIYLSYPFKESVERKRIKY